MASIIGYKKKALEIRRTVLKMIHEAGTSHIGSNFSCIDFLTVLYDKANLDKDLKPDRDRIIFSKGWAAATCYAFLADKRIIPREDLDTYCKGDSLYIGLLENSVRGVEVTTGSMGHGLPIGVGLALGAKRAGEKWHTYVIMSDGELDCGTTWESALLAAHHKLDNLTVIVDCNGWQAMGRTKEVLDVSFHDTKFYAFDWHTEKVDGHDFQEIEHALNGNLSDAPKIIFAYTTKGKGVSFMEDRLDWHYRHVSVEDYIKALKELV